jgi:hypothetical protein
VRELLANVHSGRFVNISSRENGEELENQIINILKSVSAKISGRVMESLPRDNRLVQMVESGAKGSDLNMTQMVALLGQQIVDGKRIQNTLKDRTLPHFTKFDDGAESRGFVESSFVEGLRPAEYFFHAMGGREGLIDTAVKTSDTGYIQRRMMKTMEDMHVTYDGTVRNNMGTIIQYRYGEDGVESIQVEAQPIRLAIMTLEDIYKMFGLNLAELNPMLVEAVTEAPDLVEDIIADREMLVRDVFMFMIDGGSIVDGGGERDQLHRGFYTWNSEVGSATWGIAMFLFQECCGNFQIWGQTQKTEIKMRHTKGAPVKFQEIYNNLSKYLNSGTSDEVSMIHRAKQFELPAKDEARVNWVLDKGFTKGEAKGGIELALSTIGDCQNLWQLVDGLTMHSRNYENMDARLDLDKRAGKLMDLVAA